MCNERRDADGSQKIDLPKGLTWALVERGVSIVEDWEDGELSATELVIRLYQALSEGIDQEK